MDTLSEVLRAIRLTGAVYFTIDGSSPWVVETPPGAVIAPHIGGGVEHVVNYHVITSGACWAGLVGEPAFRIEAGDIVAFPHGDPHVLSSEPGMRARADADVYQAASRQNVPLCVSLQGGGPAGAALVCGFLGLRRAPVQSVARRAAARDPPARRARGHRGGARPHRSGAGRIDRAPTGQRGRAVAFE